MSATEEKQKNYNKMLNQLDEEMGWTPPILKEPEATKVEEVKEPFDKRLIIPIMGVISFTFFESIILALTLATISFAVAAPMYLTYKFINIIFSD